MVLGFGAEPCVSWIVRWVITLTLLAFPIVALGCGADGTGDTRGSRIEGTEPGDCEDGADNDADGLFDCDDTSCAASPLCSEGGAGGNGGAGGMGGSGATSGTGGAGGSMLCAGVDCDDQNECTEDACDPMDGICSHTNVTDGTSCDFGGLPGICGAGVCEDAMLCAGVDCDDQNECTEDACDPMDGTCGHTDVTDGLSCDFGGLPGVCTVGVCEDAMLCAGVDCDDQNECTEDACDPMDGACGHTNVANGTLCSLAGSAGECRDGACTTAACLTNALCHTCPDQFLCDTDDDCPFSGYVCVASGCETGEGLAIKQCQPSRGGSCSTATECPNSTDYECVPVGAGSNHCVRVTPGCSPATESYDCLPGFSCEVGACVDRRVPCDSYLDCPKSHICSATPTASFCVRVYRTCHEDQDCAGFGSFCVDVDGDAIKECAGELGSSGGACVNADCGSSLAPVCEAGATGTAATCGGYGLCITSSDCSAGFECAGLWQDGRKECVPMGGSCNRATDCPLQHVCASSRAGGPPSCQGGSAP